MIYPIEIYNPFPDRFGGKVRFRLPQEIKEIKAITIGVVDEEGLINEVSGLPVEIWFDLFQFSLLLNNGNDEVIADAPYQFAFFRRMTDWGGGGSPYQSIEQTYHKQKVLLNKDVLKNSVQYAVFKMTDDLIAYGATNAGTLAFVNWLRTAGNFQLILYIEAA